MSRVQRPKIKTVSSGIRSARRLAKQLGLLVRTVSQIHSSRHSLGLKRHTVGIGFPTPTPWRYRGNGQNLYHCSAKTLRRCYSCTKRRRDKADLVKVSAQATLGAHLVYFTNKFPRPLPRFYIFKRSEERRVGKECSTELR